MFSLLTVQVVLRKCFDYKDLLFVDQLPQQFPWINRILEEPESTLSMNYMSLVLLSCLPPVWLLWGLRPATIGRPDWLLVAARSMLAIQLLFLPGTYGWLLADRSLPPVLSIDGKPTPVNEQAWLVWQDRDVVVYLRLQQKVRSIVQLPRSSAGAIELALTKILTGK